MTIDLNCFVTAGLLIQILFKLQLSCIHYITIFEYCILCMYTHTHRKHKYMFKLATVIYDYAVLSLIINC